MAGRKRRGVAAELSRAAERFERWRRTRGGRERIPARLWRRCLRVISSDPASGRPGSRSDVACLQLPGFSVMLQITPQMRLLVAIEPVDFRKGIDGLVHLCKQSLGEDQLRGELFAFRNRRSTAVKVLVYDGQGYWLCRKRLSAGCFRCLLPASVRGLGHTTC
jgi:hypothetical protein